jgi:acyl carrier protein
MAPSAIRSQTDQGTCLMNDKALECVYAAIDEANEDRPDLLPLEKSFETPIHGTESGLDSLGLINFLIAVEEGIERSFGVFVSLSDDRALSREPSPFESVRTLVGYIEDLLSEQQR